MLPGLAVFVAPPSLTLSASGSFSASRSGTGPLTTNSVTITASDGSGSYSYLWTPSVPASIDMTPNTPTTAATTYSGTADLSPVSGSDFARCTVTDTVLGTVALIEVPITVTVSL